MNRAGWPFILVLSCGVVLGAEAGEYRVEVIGGGALTLTQPRCVRVSETGHVYFLSGEKDRVYGRVLGPDFSPVGSFGRNGRASGQTGHWFHPASLRPTRNGDLLVADTGNRRVLLFGPDGKFKKVLVPSGDAAGALEGPTDVLELPGGDWVVCDSSSSRVLLYDGSGKLKRVIASKGKKHSQVNGPFSLAIDREGDLWVVDTMNRRLVERGTDFAVKRVVKPTTAGGPLLRWPSYLDFDRDGNLLVADDGNSCVLKLSPEGRLLARIGMTPGEPWPFSRVSGIAVCPDGTILASDVGRDLLLRFDVEGRYLGRIGRPVHPGRPARPVAFGVGADGGFFWVMSKPPCSGHTCAPDGSLRAWFGGEGTQPGKLLRPRDAALGPDGHIYVADSENHRITVYTRDGIFLRAFGRPGSGESDMRYPRAVAVDDDGRVYVGDAGNRRVQLYEPTGKFLRTFAREVNPRFIDVAPDGSCAVYDDALASVVVLDRSGRQIARANVTGVSQVAGLAFAPDGRLWVLDSERGVMRMFDADAKTSRDVRDDRFQWATGPARGRDGKMYVSIGSLVSVGLDGTPGSAVVPREAIPPGKLIRPTRPVPVWKDELAVLSGRSGIVEIFGRDGTYHRRLETRPPLAPGDIAAGPSGDLCHLDYASGRLTRVSRDGRAEVVLSSAALRGGAAAVIGGDGKIYLFSWSRRGLVILDAKGEELGVIRSARGRRRFGWPRAFCVTPAGEVLIADGRGGGISCYGTDLKLKWVLDQAAPEETRWERGGAEAIRVDQEGNIFLLAAEHNCIRKFSRDRKHLADITLDEALDGRFRRPTDLCIDDAGRLYVADTGNNRVLKFTPKR